MPSKPALPMVIRLAKKTVRNESRANDNANKTQSTKNGSHAASTMAQRLITLRSIRWRLSQLCPCPGLRLTEGICRFTERVWLQRTAGRYVRRDPKRSAACSQEVCWQDSVYLSPFLQGF